MDDIWGRRRFFVPGVVFLSVLAILAALSGTFSELDLERGEAGLAAIAAVVAGGIAGYPLGLVLYIPFAMLFRWPRRGYDCLVKCRKFCCCFLSKTDRGVASPSGGALKGFREVCEAACGDPHRAETFYGFLLDRFAPHGVHDRIRGRWEAMHTIGGMISAIIFGLGLSPLIVAVTPHGTAWWDDKGLLASIASIVPVVVLLLAIYAWNMAHEAARIERQWWKLFLDLVGRTPEILDAAVLDDRFNK